MSPGEVFDRDRMGTSEYGRPPPVVSVRDRDGPYAVQLTAKCRRCDVCLRERANLWARRAVQEVTASSRTWFCTLTLSPMWHEHFANLARAKCDKRVQRFETLPLDRQMLERHLQIGAEVQLSLKRMRKAGHRFRYLIVLEAHQSGLPHYHMLVHEMGTPITKRELEASLWAFGFAQFRLVDRDDRRAGWYVCKYLSKTSAARVRASLRYGGDARGSEPPCDLDQKPRRARL